MISLTREHKRWSTIGQIALMVLGLGLMMSGCAGQDAIEPGRSTTPRSNVHGGADPCGLLTRAEVQRAIGHSVLPPRRSDSDGRACDWTASDVPDSSGPRPTLVPGPATGTPYQPPVYPGVTLMLVTADWSSLRAEVGKHEGQQTAHGVTGVGDEAIMFAIGSSWRQLYVRRGATTIDVVVSLDAGHGATAVEHAEVALGTLTARRL
jgi:hypothetical protein